jgi:hypothetical protein
MLKEYLLNTTPPECGSPPQTIQQSWVPAVLLAQAAFLSLPVGFAQLVVGASVTPGQKSGRELFLARSPLPALSLLSQRQSSLVLADKCHLGAYSQLRFKQPVIGHLPAHDSN